MSTKKFAIIIGVIFAIIISFFVGKYNGYDDAIESAQLIYTTDDSYIIGYGDSADPDCHIYKFG